MKKDERSIRVRELFGQGKGELQNKNQECYSGRSNFSHVCPDVASFHTFQSEEETNQIPLQPTLK